MFAEKGEQNALSPTVAGEANRRQRNSSVKAPMQTDSITK